MRRDRNLFLKIVSFDNLLKASKKALRGKRNKKSVSRFYFNLENELIELQHELESNTYRPKDYRIFEIRDPKPRKISSSDIRDRVVHHAICNLLEPIFESRLIYDTYACRIGKGSHAAIERCQHFSKNHSYYLKFDIRKYFENVDHEVLKKLLRNFFKDQPLLRLMDLIIDHPVLGNSPGKGLSIGNLTSQYYANIYLEKLDHFLKEHIKLKFYIRYMDDAIVFSNEKKDLQSLLMKIRTFLSDELNLELKEKVTTIAPVSEGIPFLGFRIYPNLIRLQGKNLRRFRKKILEQQKRYDAGELNSDQLIQSMNSRITHISHANTYALRRKEFEFCQGVV